MAVPVRSVEETDETLVARAIRGDRTAYATLHRRHATYIAGVVYRLLGRDGELEDVVQETFVRGFRELKQLRDPAKLRAFLVTIAARRVGRKLRWRARQRAFLAELTEAKPRWSDPMELDELKALCELLESCQARHRIAWVLHRVEGFTLLEVADATQASLASVKRWIAKVDQLIEALE